MRAAVTRLVARHSSAAPRRLSRSHGGIAPARLRRVNDLIEARLDTISVAAMAAEAGLSPYHFAREFKRATGTAPWRHVIARRLARATGLLSDPDLPIAEVARRAGFADARHLNHRMRERLGCSPSQLRSRILL